MRYKAVFFDLDGTLMDTSDGIFAGGRYAMETVGAPMPEVVKWEKFIGPPLGDCFRISFGVKDDAVVEKLCKAYHDFYDEEGYARARFYPGILDVVKELKRRGYVLGIASMKNEDLVQKMCRHFGTAQYFDQQLGIDLVGTMTKAELLKKGFKALGLKPSECILVGDTDYDVRGAVGAQCDYIKVNWGFGFTEKDPGTISEPAEILDLV